MGRGIGCENPDVSAETQGVGRGEPVARPRGCKVGASRWLAREGAEGR